MTIKNIKGYVLMTITIIVITALSISSKNSHFSGSHMASFDSLNTSDQSNDSDQISTVKSYLMSSVLKDTASYKPMEWSKVSIRNDSTYQVTHTFNARNTYRAYEVKTMVFIVSEDRLRVLRHYTLY